MDESFGRYFDSFVEGEVVVHPRSHVISLEENLEFCEITKNDHPLHSNQAYAKESQHGKLVISGPHVLALAVGLTVPEISGKAIANLSYESIQHHAPTFVSDLIRVETQIINKRASKTKPDRGLIKVKSTVFNQRGEMVMSFIRTVLIPMSGD